MLTLLASRGRQMKNQSGRVCIVLTAGGGGRRRRMQYWNKLPALSTVFRPDGLVRHLCKRLHLCTSGKEMAICPVYDGFKLYGNTVLRVMES